MAFSVFSLNMILIICYATIVQQYHDMYLLLIRLIRMSDSHCFHLAANFVTLMWESISFCLGIEQRLVYLSGHDHLFEYYKKDSRYSVTTF